MLSKSVVERQWMTAFCSHHKPSFTCSACISLKPLQQDHVLTFVQRGHLMDRNTTIPLPIKGYIVQPLLDSVAIYSASVGIKALHSWTTVKPVKLMQRVMVFFGKVEDGLYSQ